MRILALFYLLISLSALAREVPRLTSPVMDEANVLSRPFANKLSAILRQVYLHTGKQIQVFIIESLYGDNLEDYSIRVIERWKLGHRGKDDGILFLIVNKDRMTRIEVGRGLEGELTDLLAGRIIDRLVVPHFKNGNYEIGVWEGIKGIATTIGVELPRDTVPLPSRKSSAGGALIIIIVILVLLFNRSRSRFFGGGFGGGWGGGGFSSGGWSGGGGGFSGGGASGRW